MPWLKKTIWIFVSLLGGAALAIVTGWFRPQEQVNALWLLAAAGCFYAITYRFYATFIAARALSLDETRVTPAYRLRDNMDFEPTNRWVLFGHHFAAIAGAGPLIGPMLAAQFGYLPGFLWILIGAALAGAVHDMVILAASVKRDGQSLAQIAKAEIGPVGGFAASLAIIFIIIVALAGLGLAVVNALASSPWGTYTIALTIPIALLIGFYLKNLRPGQVGEASFIGVLLLFLAVISGHWVIGSGLEPFFTLSHHQLIVALAIYGLAASVLPVWMLLCPRDYLSTYMKIGTILLLALGVVFLAPKLQMPATTVFVHGSGPVIPGKLFPFMFITIACGAISGFHSLIASGTTPKMIMNENEIQVIGFGAMLTEGIVGLMALIAATVLMPGDYFAINTKLSLEQLAALGFPVQRIHDLCSLVGVNVMGRPGGAVSLAVGMASILGKLPGFSSLMPYWYNFALMFEALFILTTVDAGTRVARFLVQEMAGSVIKPLARRSWLPGILLTSLLVVGAWAYLIYSGSVSTIWPMFGVSNQLLAAIALGIGSIILLRENKSKYVWITLLPMLFMFTTTLTASWELWGMFVAKAGQATLASEALTFKIDAGLVLLMAVLALISLADMVGKGYSVWKTLPNKVHPSRNQG